MTDDLVARLRRHTLHYSEQESAADEITRLRLIETAARNLIAVKGRHHTEQAYKQLDEVLKE